MYKVAIYSFASILLAGCQSLYQVNDKMKDTSIEFMSADTYWMHFYEGTRGCEKPVQLPTQYEPWRTGALPLPVEPGKEFMFSLGQAGRTGTILKACQSTAAFIPEAGKRYRARYVRDELGCKAIVNVVDSGPNGPVETLAPTYKNYFDNSPPSPNCPAR